MAAPYLDWLTQLFDEAQVPYNERTAPHLDAALRRVAGFDASADPETVYRRLRERWLNQGPPGWQLLAGWLRDEAYSRRDSALRPKEGEAYFTNDWEKTRHAAG